MVVAVKILHADKEGMKANRRHAKDYYRDAFMAREPRGKVSRPETFQEPSKNLPGNSVR